jgi:hypothetical protein
MMLAGCFVVRVAYKVPEVLLRQSKQNSHVEPKRSLKHGPKRLSATEQLRRRTMQTSLMKLEVRASSSHVEAQAFFKALLRNGFDKRRQTEECSVEPQAFEP